jgi:NAD-dependent dihydropyrimidine dehydrogenase PreA subunit
MANTLTRKIVKIDETQCNGCGLCIPNCAEGAIRIVDGKARLLADKLCDGLGACLGHCPQDAIVIEERPADEFNEHAVEQRRREQVAKELQVVTPEPTDAKPQAEEKPCGCPGARMRMLNPGPRIGENGDRHRFQTTKSESVPVFPDAAPVSRPSMLGHWPVQLALLPAGGPVWQDADVLICADCVPFAFPEFHEMLLTGPDGNGRTVAIACPKLDDIGQHTEKLAAIFAGNNIRSITVAHMEVPCCGGIVRAVAEALKQAGRTDIPVLDVTVGIDGTMKDSNQ